MKIVLQRVKKAAVTVESEIVSEINRGLFVLLGVEKGDTNEISKYLANKVINLRIFDDEFNKMNLSIRDVAGEFLVVSQFTLASRIKKGNRPSFSNAMEDTAARKLYEEFIDEIKRNGVPIQTGIFRKRMEVSLINDGPVTFILEKSEQE